MRPEKASIVSDLSEKLNRSPFLLVTDYQHMKVDQFGELRNRLAPAGADPERDLVEIDGRCRERNGSS